MSYLYSKGKRVFGDIEFEDDTNTQIDFEDDYIALVAGGTTLLAASGSMVGIGTDTPDYTLDVAGDIGVDQKIYHNGDGNTYINFTDDRIRFEAGGLGFIGMHKKASAPHQVTINNGNNNIDFVVNSNNNSNDPILRCDASAAGVGIRTASPIAELDVAGKIAITAESSTPSQPSDGQGYLYTKTDGKIYWRSHDVSETDLTAVGEGGGGSSIDILKIALASETNFTWNGSSGDFHKVPFTRNLIDTFSGSPFNTSTNVFTAPSDGVYEFSVQLTFNNIQDDTTQYQAWLMTSVSSDDTYTISGMYGAALTQFDPPVSNAINRLDLFTVLDMAANQTITVYVRQQGGTQNNCHLLSWPMQTSLVIKKLL